MSLNARRAGEEGMTLVEVMIALLIVGLILSALASSLATSLRAVRGQEAQTQATAAINDILEEAQRVDYDQAVLCPDKAEATFGTSLTFEGEDIIVASGVCDTADEVLPQRTVDRDGRTYDVRTAITWADDEGDGLDTSDPDSPQDIKRIVVEVDWVSDGQSRTARNMAFRAPQFLEQLLTAEVVPSTGEFVRIADDLDSEIDEGENADAFTLRAYAREPLTSVTVSWVDREDKLEEWTMNSPTSDGLTWEYHLSTNFGPFANGGTLFTFEGVSTTGDTETVTARGLFLYDPMEWVPDSSGHVVRNNLGVIETSRDLRIDGATGLVCPGQQIWVDARGAIRSDIAQADWGTGGPATIDDLVAVDPWTPDESFVLSGSRFLLDLSDRAGFATQNADGTYSVSNSAVPVKVTVTRIVDNTSLDRENSVIKPRLVPSC